MITNNSLKEFDTSKGIDSFLELFIVGKNHKSLSTTLHHTNVATTLQGWGVGLSGRATKKRNLLFF